MALSAALLLGACSKGEDNGGQTLPDGEYPMTFTAAGIALSVDTKATTDNNWQGVDQVAIQVDGAVKPYDVEASGDYTTATLSSDDPFYWQSTDPIEVSAWWPYAETMPDVVVQADQNEEDNFNKSDYISATNTIEFGGSTALTFTHRTAKVTVSLKRGEGMTDEELAQATVTLTSVTTGNAADGNTVTPYQNTTALLPPQTIAAGQPFIQITLTPGVTYVYKTEEAAQLQGGYQYTYTITVNKAGLDLAGNSISSWTDNPGGPTEGTATLPYIYDASTNTYTVYTADGLDAWAADERGGNWGANCILANDIDYGGRTWGGTEDINGFDGTFDGGGYTISNMVIPASGLVKRLYGTVQNLVLDGVELQTANGYHGLIAGTNNGTIAGCTVLSSCKIISNDYGYIGGIAGYNNSGLITRCHAEHSFEGSNNSADIGGIAGSNRGSITASSYKGSYNVTGKIAGSLIGYFGGGSATACWTSVTLGSSATMAGMAGRQSGGTLTACYWEGNGITDNGTGTQVTGGNWTDAINDMNTELGADFGWQWTTDGDGLPTLVPNE